MYPALKVALSLAGEGVAHRTQQNKRPHAHEQHAAHRGTPCYVGSAQHNRWLRLGDGRARGRHNPVGPGQHHLTQLDPTGAGAE